VPIDRPLGDAAVVPQPILELDHTSVARRDRSHCLLLHDPALAEELDEPAHAPHVPHGDMRPATITWAAAAMPREAIDNGFVDVGDWDLRLRQPMGKVANCTVIEPHRQGGISRVREMVRELRHPRGKIVRMHAPSQGAPILISLGHDASFCCHQGSRGKPNYAESESGLSELTY
jgi:hypothetical protein